MGPVLTMEKKKKKREAIKEVSRKDLQREAAGVNGRIRKQKLKELQSRLKKQLRGISDELKQK